MKLNGDSYVKAPANRTRILKRNADFDLRYVLVFHLDLCGSDEESGI